MNASTLDRAKQIRNVAGALLRLGDDSAHPRRRSVGRSVALGLAGMIEHHLAEGLAPDETAGSEALDGLPPTPARD